MPSQLNPAYDAGECLEILRLAAAVDSFIPLYGGGKDAVELDPLAPASQPPIQDVIPSGLLSGGVQTAPVMPSIFYHRWPAGWTAGIVKFPIKPTWRHSIACSIGPSAMDKAGKEVPIPTFSNQCLLTYNKQRDAYCLAFRGTATLGNVLEDLLALPVPAGPINFLDEALKIPEDIRKLGIGFGQVIDKLLELVLPRWAVRDLDDVAAWAEKVAADIVHLLPDPLKWLPAKWLSHIILGLVQSNRSYVLPDLPGISERAAVHAGFRIALESLDFAPSPLVLPDWHHPTLGDLSDLVGLLEPNTLTGMLQHLADQAGGKPIKLYVTGHSLGAGMASLAAAWLKTQPFKGATFDVKLYAFAQPKPGNEYFSYAVATAFDNTGSFAVLNSLDTVPQVAMTVENLESLNFVGCIDFLLDGLGPAGKAVKDMFSALPPWNYVHSGQVVILPGAPVQSGTTPADSNGFYNLPPLPSGGYAYPAYLFAPLQPGASNNATVPQKDWTVQPVIEGIGNPAAFANLWQHMPWSYEEGMVRLIKG
jgi:hypothetical protein